MKKELQKRRGILLAFLGFLCVISVKAQTWTAPTFEHQTDDLSSHVGEVFYLYNVGQSAYLTYGGSYGTRAVMGPVGYPMYLRASGLNYKFEFVTSPLHNGSTHYLFDAGSGNVFTDNSTQSDWTCTYDGTSKSYTIANTAAATKYLASQTTTSTNANVGNGFKAGGAFYFILDNIATNDNYAKWRFVTPKQKALLDLSNLFTYVTANPSFGIDLTSYVAIYNNSASATTDLTTDLTNLKNAIYATATTSNPVEVTNFAIANPSFEFKSVSSMDSWVVSVGSLAPANSAEISGTFPEAGSNFVEYYQGTGNIPALTIQQTINSLPAGKYSLKAILKGAANGSTSPANIKLFAGSFNTSITTMPTTATKYEVQNIISDGSALNIGIQYTTGANWFAADYFQLYYYGPVPIVSTSKSSFAFSVGDSPYLSDNLTVSGFDLSDVISISAPTGITVSPTTPLASNASNVPVTVTYDGTTSVSGNITFTSGSTITTVAVTGTPSCFTPLYPSGNLVTNPLCTNIATYKNWGTTAIITGANAYCGSSVQAAGANANAGSIDYTLTSKLLANTTYRLRAMMYANGNAGITLNGCGINGSTSDYKVAVNTSGAWQLTDFTFTTGTLGSSQNFWFNSNGGTAKDIRMDNFEIYKVPGIRVAEASVPVMSSVVGSSDSKTITVDGNGLTAGVTLALSGANADQFSFSPATTLPLVAATDAIATTTVTITYTPTGASISHVATLTLSSPGAADKTFALSASASATGVRPVSSNGSVSVINRTLKVEGSQSIEVFTAQGLRIAQSKVNNESYSVVLTPGIYIVKLDAGVKKVVVK